MIVGEDGYSIYQRKNAIVIGLPDRWDCRWCEKLVEPREPFDDDRWNECGSGIHFFINRQEAVNY